MSLIGGVVFHLPLVKPGKSNLSAQDRIDLFRFLSELGKPGPYDASKGNIARVWRARTAAHTDEQRGDDKIINADPTGKEWTPASHPR